ncbi:hypothetical protein U1Q18_023161, partial [Sarracenia purpurea var. burkii]
EEREERSYSATLGGSTRADFPPPTTSHENGSFKSKPATQSRTLDVNNPYIVEGREIWSAMGIWIYECCSSPPPTTPLEPTPSSCIVG